MPSAKMSALFSFEYVKNIGYYTYSSVRIPDYNAMSSRPRIHHADHPPVFCIGETPPQSISSDCSGNPLCFPNTQTRSLKGFFVSFLQC